MTDRIQNRRGTASQWTAVNPTLLSGELGVETDTGKLKVGDGSTAWASRNYAGGSTNASDLVSGTLADARLSSNVPLKNAAAEFSNTFTFAGIQWKEDNATPAYNDYWRGWLSSFDVNTPSSSNLDTVMRWGFNVASGGGKINASDASFADSVESEFWHNGVNVMERHWEGFTKQGTSFRIISALIPKNDSDASTSAISYQANNYVFQDWAKTQRISYNFNNATTSAIVHSTKANYQFPTQNGYLYSQMNQSNNAIVHGPFLNSFNKWQFAVGQVYSNSDSTYDPGTALVAIRRNGNGSANEISLDVSMENANSPNLWIAQKWSGVCHGGLEPLIENFSDQSTGLASLKIKTANGGGDARIVWNTGANNVSAGVDISETQFVVAKSASLGTSNLIAVDLATNLTRITGETRFGGKIGLGSTTAPTNYLESVSDGVARIVAQNGTTASELRVASIQDAADSVKFTVGGRLHIGATQGDTGWLGIQNVLSNGSSFNNCALIQNASGYTIVNASSGQTLDFRIAMSSKLKVTSGGVTVQSDIGFNNTDPISKPTVTGSRGGNAALASLLTALANYGLITDSTS